KRHVDAGARNSGFWRVPSLHSGKPGGKEALAAVFPCGGRIAGASKGGAFHENEGCNHQGHAVSTRPSRSKPVEARSDPRIRDSVFILEGLLEQQTGLRPHEVMSDTAGYCDLVFGLIWLLGYQFSPRLADFEEAGSGG